MKKRYRLSVIDKPSAKASILHRTTPGPVLTAHGERSYECGSCGKVLLKNVRRMQLQGDIVLKCLCGAFNKMPTAHQTN